MPTFLYVARDGGGLEERGLITSESVAEAVQMLETRGWKVESIHTEEKSLPVAEQKGRLQSTYMNRIDAALENSQGLVSAIEALNADKIEIGLVESIQPLVAALKRGVKAEEFLKSEELVATLPLVLSHQQESSLASDRFEVLGRWLNAETVTRRSIWKGLSYPLVVLTLSICILIALVVTIVPQYKSMFNEFELRLPQPTRILIGISDELTNQPVRSFLVFAGGFLIVGAIIRGMQKIWPRVLATRFLGGVFAGSSSNLIAMSRFTETLAELLAIEAPLSDAISLAGVASQQFHIRNKSMLLANELRNLEDPWSNSRVLHNFPPSVVHALRAGRTGGPSIPMLRQLSAMYGERVGQRPNVSSGIVGPLAIVLVGILVGMSVIAVFMPIISLITSLS